MAKILIELNKPILDFSDDADASDGMKASHDKSNTLARTLSTLLKVSQEGDALKHLDWALDLYRNGKIEVDESDFKYLREFVQNSKNMWALVKGQLLRALDASKESKQAAVA